MRDVVFSAAGPSALLMTLASAPSEALLNRIFAMQRQIEADTPAWLVDVVPAYVSIHVEFDAAQVNRFQVQQWLASRWQLSMTDAVLQPNVHTLPVYYSAEYCPDLDIVAAMKGMAIDDVITLHSAFVYRVYALGFAPGFAYLGELDEGLRVPRLAAPRARIPAGAVAIAERQTAIYPAASPAGWHVLGLCPLDLNPQGEQLTTRFAVGDEVRFEAVDQETFLALGGVLEVVA